MSNVRDIPTATPLVSIISFYRQYLLDDNCLSSATGVKHCFDRPTNKTLIIVPEKIDPEIIVKPVAVRHQEASGSLALLLRYCEVSEGSRVAAPRGDKVLWNGEKLCPSVRRIAHRE